MNIPSCSGPSGPTRSRTFATIRPRKSGDSPSLLGVLFVIRGWGGCGVVRGAGPSGRLPRTVRCVLPKAPGTCGWS